jgi:hypothetical protein
MHTNKTVISTAAIIEAIGGMEAADLDRVQAAISARRGGIKTSTVLERRPYRDGVLQLEMRRNPSTGTERGPYWYFHLRRGGRQRTVYIGKTDQPEARTAEKLGVR